MAGLKRRIHVGKGLPFFIFLKSAVCGAWRIIRARFARVTQNPLRGFCLPGKLDGDSAPHTLGSGIFPQYAGWLLLKIVAA